MGAWDYGLLDNDTAADELGEVINTVVDHAVRSAARALSRQGAGEFAAQLGLLLHFEPEVFGAAHEANAALRAGIARNRRTLDEVAPKASELLDQLAAGKAPSDGKHTLLLRAKHARAYLQELADRTIDDADVVFKDEMTIGGYLVVLGVLSKHVELQAHPIKRWLASYRTRYREAGEDERLFLREELHMCKKLVEAASEADAE
jgi:hypothetical protein